MDKAEAMTKLVLKSIKAKFGKGWLKRGARWKSLQVEADDSTR